MTLEVRRLLPTEGAHLRTIRLRALADAPAAFATTHLEAETRPPEWWDEAAAHGAASDVSATFVAVLDGAWAGMVSAFRPVERPTAVELVQMWTDPVARRHGLALALVDAVVAWAEAVGGAEVTLWVMRGNDSAFRLYERCGFDRTEDVQPLASDPCKDEIRMVRRMATT